MSEQPNAQDGQSNDGQNQQSMLDVDRITKGNQNDSDDPAANANPAPNPAPNPTHQTEPGREAERPEWLTEDKFWDEEKGQIKAELLFKNHNELLGKFSRGEHKAPDKPEGYKLEISEENMKTLFNDPKADPFADPGIKSLAEWGVKNKISNAAMNELLDKYAEFVEPEIQKQTIDVEAEKKKLGKNADAVIETEINFVEQLFKTGRINEGHLGELKILFETAEGIQAFRALREYYGEAPIPTNPVPQEGMKSESELRAMRNDPRYGEDKEYTKQVDQAYSERYGDKPAISSARRNQ